MREKFLQIEIEKNYPGFNLKANLMIHEGEFFSLVGPSGCGKTTLLRLISGLEEPDQGQIIMAGADITLVPPAQRRIGFVFQDYALFPHLTVAGNIEYGLKVQRLPALKRQARVRELLALFELEKLGKRKIQELSGGERQRVALARALAPEPLLLLMDEPFSALDYSLRRRLRRELKELQEKLGFTAIFVTHQQEEALSLSERLAIMKDGRIIQTGTAVEVYENPHYPFVADFLGDANLIPCSLEFEAGIARVYLQGDKTLSLPAFKGEKTGRYLLMVRPEDLFLKPDDSIFQGEISSLEYFGHGYHIELTTSEGLLLKIATGKENHDLQKGQFYGVGICPGAAKLIPINS